MTDENKDPEGCKSCKWYDPTQAQCYDGHIQSVGPCNNKERRNDEVVRKTL